MPSAWTPLRACPFERGAFVAGAKALQQFQQAGQREARTRLGVLDKSRPSEDVDERDNFVLEFHGCRSLLRGLRQGGPL